MKAIQVKEPYSLELINRDRPSPPADDEVTVKVKRMGICGSDLHIFHGENPFVKYPRVIGHEIAGEVIEIGRNVSGLKVGDKVVVEPITYCGECYACKQNRPNVCVNLQVNGVHKDGGGQEYINLPSYQLHKMNPTLDWSDIVLVEPFTIGAQAIYRGNVQEDDIVFIIGAGPVGLCCLKIAKLSGAKVIISDLNEDRLAFAAQWGADLTINPAKEDYRKKINEYTSHLGANVVIDAVGTTTTFEQTIEVSSVAGRIVLLGFNTNPSQISQVEITKKELTICGSRLQTNRFPYVVQLFNEGKLDVSGFVSHEFPLTEVKEAFNLIENAQTDIKKVLLRM